MKWQEFVRKICLPEDAVQSIQQMGLTEEDYQKLLVMYEVDHEEFTEYVLQQPDSPLYFLSVYCRMACDVYDRYREQKIEETIFWDTFRDILFWCENYKKEYGSYGIGEYGWFWRHMDMTLFRLGRLQYEKIVLQSSVGEEADGLGKGTAVMNVHIPQGEKLGLEECKKSLAMARERYGNDIPFVCHSWLLGPELRRILPTASNILQFQGMFRVLQIDYREREAEWRTFGTVKKNIADYPEDTGLQRAMKEHLLKGYAFGNGWGVVDKSV